MSLPNRYLCREGEPFVPPVPGHLTLIQTAMKRLDRELRPRLRPVLVERNGTCAIRGIVGSVDVCPDLTIDLEPKIEVANDQDWAASVVDLLLPRDRVSLGGEQRVRPLGPRRKLVDEVAAKYAHRLQSALRRDGPLALFERRRDTLPVMKGRLEVARWLSRAPVEPQRFPVRYDALSMDNDFTQALAFVARNLAMATADPAVRARLVNLAREVRPGGPESNVDSSIADRPLPPQYSAYGPAWAIARAVLGRGSLLGRSGHSHGLAVAVEVWPLLETLVNRSCEAAAAQSKGRLVAYSKGERRALLVRGRRRKRVEPDARIDRDGRTVATFEAKYKTGPLPRGWPRREDLFQAICTAAVFRAPLGVLVYPGRFEPYLWRTRGTRKRPGYVAAIGLDMYGYRQGHGDLARGERLLSLLTQIGLVGGSP